MEKKRSLIVAAICFGISLLLVAAYTTVRRKEMTKDFGNEVVVIVANQPIPEYSIIRREMLEATTVFSNFLQPQASAVAPGQEEAAFDAIVGKASYVPIYKGEQITLTKLVHQDGKPVLDRQVEKKNRAVTVQIAPHTGVGRLIRPGNRVDIMASVSYEQGSSLQFEIKTVFQNVLVLATGKNLQNQVPTRVNRNVLGVLETQFEEQRRKDIYTTTVDSSGTSRPDDNYSTLTLQMVPEEAQKLLYLQHTIGDSRLYYTLRNSADQTVVKLDTTILDNILGPDTYYGQSKVKPPPSPPPRPKYYDTEGGTVVPRY
jgi:pilus assembly protein CpaB